MLSCMNTHIGIALRICVSLFTGPVPPADVSFAVTDKNTAVLSWTASQSRVCDVVVGNYSVRYKLSCTRNTGGYTTVYSSHTSVTLQGLLSNAEYTVSVAAINPNGNTSDSSTLTAVTRSEMAPSESKVASLFLVACISSNTR